METQDSSAHASERLTSEPQRGSHDDHSRLHVFMHGLRDIVETAPAVIIMTGADGVIQYVNPRFRQATGYADEDVLGRPISEIAKDSESHEEAWQTLMSGRTWCGDVAFKRKDGGEYWAQAAINPIRAADGEVERFLGVHVEITGQKRAERELEERNAYWRAIAESAPDIIVTLSRDGTITTINRANGADPASVAGNTVFDYVLPEFHQAWRDALAFVFDQGHITQVECASTEPTGRVGWWENSLAPVWTDGEVTAAVCVSHDVTEHIETERRLGEREEQWRALLDSAPSIIGTLDRDGTITSINRVVGGQVSDLIGTSAYDRALPEYREAYRQALATVFEEGKPAVVDVEAESLDGLRWWYSNNLAPVWTDGKVSAAVCIATDITERRATEEALRERESYWRALIESAPEFIVTVDRQGRITSVNREIDGGRPEDAVGHSVFDFAEESAHEQWRETLARVFERGETAHHENRAALTSGEDRWWAYRVGPVKKGDEVVAGIIVSHDITEIRESEQRLRESEAHWRALSENAPDFIIVVDRAGTIQRLNRTINDTPKEEIEGRTIYHYLDEKAQAEWRQALERVFSTGEPQTLENQSRNMGPPRWYLSSLGPIYDGDRVTAAVVVSRDITARRKAEERLRALATAVSDVIVVVDGDGVLQEVLGPRAGQGLLPPDPASLRGTRIQDHLSGPEAELTVGFVRETIASGLTLEGEIRLDLDEGPVWLLGRSAPLTLDDGRRVAVVHVSDITERKRLEEELAVLREEVESEAEGRQEKASEFGLTFREVTVLGFIARGRSDKEIAALLGVSPFTVNKQSASATRKLKARSRSEAVARAIRAGII